MSTYRKEIKVETTVRIIFPAPLDLKTLGIACAVVAREFEIRHGRKPAYDNDYWLEPLDDEIAFAFKVETTKEQS